MRWTLVVCLLAIGCVSRPKLSGPVELRLKGEKGQVVDTAYHSQAHITEFEDEQKTKDREEVLDFVVRSTVTDVTPGLIAMHVETIKKDGTGNLNDFAFPELKKSYDLVLSPDGEVKKAGRFPMGSIFYVPPVSLPPGPVEIGDTWNMKSVWVSRNSGVPLYLELVTIFKDVVACQPGIVCADLEVSGEVTLGPPGKDISSAFESRVWGRILFSITEGDVVRSVVRSIEKVQGQEGRMEVLSCMASLRQEKGKVQKAECTPSHSKVSL